ncbi:twin-arginine translocation signal domain-containing protein, partial [Candidatus Sumerlaeota bacterium]|nr:twin-arginine translocation signal domain-containing protein [Candidatus Sumerlaeota bacterium]
MSQTKNRREFMKESAASAAAIGAGLSILQTGCATSGKHTASAEAPSVLPGGTKPSEVVNVGLIGCGGRGTNVLMDDF